MLAYIRQVAGAKDAADCEEGASGVEYGLLVASIAAVIIALVFGVGMLVKNGMQNNCTDQQSNSRNATNASADCNK